jgi:hypothetical protein
MDSAPLRGRRPQDDDVLGSRRALGLVIQQVTLILSSVMYSSSAVK